MRIKQIKQVQQNIEEGGWVSDLPNLPGVALKVRGLFNSDASRIYGEIRASMPEEEFKKPEVQEAVEIRLLHETVLLDWHGIEDDDGNTEPFDEDLAEQLLSDPETAVFRRATTWAASNVAQTGKATLEEITKNSSTASGGN